jgi:hypothetical protein
MSVKKAKNDRIKKKRRQILHRKQRAQHKVE